MITTGTKIFREVMTTGQSMSAARRMVHEGTVKLNGTEITALWREVEVNEGDVLQIGNTGKNRRWTFDGKKWVKDSS